MKKQAIEPKELYNRQTALIHKALNFKPGKSPQYDVNLIKIKKHYINSFLLCIIKPC